MPEFSGYHAAFDLNIIKQKIKFFMFLAFENSFVFVVERNCAIIN